MLVLTRKIGQSIIIGDKMDIQVVVLGYDKGKVRIGIDAPNDIPVHRHEIAQRIVNERYNNNDDNDVILLESLREADSIIANDKIYGEI